MDFISNHFSVSKEAEITLEANPDTVSAITASSWKSCGFNRLSLGAQSMEDNILKFLAGHIMQKPIKTLMRLSEKPVLTILIVDLMFSVAEENITESLNRIISLSPEHISAYNLTIEENTLLYIKNSNGKYEAPGDDEQLDIYRKVKATLEKEGFIQYEVSNYGSPGNISANII